RTSLARTWISICVGIAGHTLLALTGLSILLQRFPPAFQTLRIGGALYLAWIAVKLLRALRQPAGNHGDVTTSIALTDREAFREGFITNVCNVKVMIFFSSLLSQFLTPGAGVLEKVAFGSIIMAEALLLWPLFVWLVHLPPVRKRFFQYQQVFNGTFAALLLFMAYRLFRSGLAAS
ncbi:MAG: LysE family transporter, partial [Verrucomicrobiota bacterium]